MAYRTNGLIAPSAIITEKAKRKMISPRVGRLLFALLILVAPFVIYVVVTYNIRDWRYWAQYAMIVVAAMLLVVITAVLSVFTIRWIEGR